MADDTQNLASLLHSLNSATLPIPDELTAHLLRQSGVDSNDARTLRLVSLAALKFLNDVIADAKRIQSNRVQAPLVTQKAEGFAREKDKEKDKRSILLTEDLTKALQEYGIDLQRAPYHVDRIETNGTS